MLSFTAEIRTARKLQSQTAPWPHSTTTSTEDSSAEWDGSESETLLSASVLPSREPCESIGNEMKWNEMKWNDEQVKWYQDLEKYNEVPASRLGRVRKQAGKLAAVAWMVATARGTNPKKLEEEYKSKPWEPGDMLSPWTQFDPHPTYSVKDGYEAFSELCRLRFLGDSDGGTWIY